MATFLVDRKARNNLSWINLTETRIA